MINKLHILISFFTGVTYTVSVIITDVHFNVWLTNLSIIMALFYILGIGIKSYLKKSFVKEYTHVAQEELEENEQ